MNSLLGKHVHKGNLNNNIKIMSDNEEILIEEQNQNFFED